MNRAGSPNLLNIQIFISRMGNKLGRLLEIRESSGLVNERMMQGGYRYD